ncbi:MAG: hypothetical protein MI924_15275, partial [Chloroflexales bacterium]|nr:hypothetical protein [Chloroflexales bacterium]
MTTDYPYGMIDKQQGTMQQDSRRTPKDIFQVIASNPDEETMLGSIIIALANGWRALLNGWRRLLRRRVDYVRLELSGTLPEFAAEPSWWQRRFLGASTPPSLIGLRRQLQRIGSDPQAKG